MMFLFLSLLFIHRSLTVHIVAYTHSQSQGASWASADPMRNAIRSSVSDVDDNPFDNTNFCFPFYLVNAKAYISANGFISIQEQPLCPRFCFPTADDLDAPSYVPVERGVFSRRTNPDFPMIAVLTTDFDPSNSYKVANNESGVFYTVYEKYPNVSTLVVEWRKIQLYNSEPTVETNHPEFTFQTEIMSNGSIIFRYVDLPSFEHQLPIFGKLFIGFVLTYNQPPVTAFEVSPAGMLISPLGIRFTPVFDECEPLKDCNTCLQQSGCGWCRTTQSCFNLEASYISIQNNNAPFNLLCPTHEVFTTTCADNLNRGNMYNVKMERHDFVSMFDAQAQAALSGAPPGRDGYQLVSRLEGGVGVRKGISKVPIKLSYPPFYFPVTYNPPVGTEFDENYLLRQLEVTEAGLVVFTKDSTRRLTVAAVAVRLMEPVILWEFQEHSLTIEWRGYFGRNSSIGPDNNITTGIWTIRPDFGSRFVFQLSLFTNGTARVHLDQVTPASGVQTPPHKWISSPSASCGAVTTPMNSQPWFAYPEPYSILLPEQHQSVLYWVSWFTLKDQSAIIYTPLPGCAVPACNGHGSCDQEVQLCHCAQNWQGDSCTECASGWYGELCTYKCPDCTNGGQCDDGKSGTGNCTCSEPYSGYLCDIVCGGTEASEGFKREFTSEGRTSPGVTLAVAVAVPNDLWHTPTVDAPTVWLIGGKLPNSTSGTREVDVYIPSERRWEPLGILLPYECWGGSAVLHNAAVWFVSPIVAPDATLVLSLQPMNNSNAAVTRWIEGPSLPITFISPHTVSYNGLLFVFTTVQVQRLMCVLGTQEQLGGPVVEDGSSNNRLWWQYKVPFSNVHGTAVIDHQLYVFAQPTFDSPTLIAFQLESLGTTSSSSNDVLLTSNWRFKEVLSFSTEAEPGPTTTRGTVHSTIASLDWPEWTSEETASYASTPTGETPPYHHPSSMSKLIGIYSVTFKNDQYENVYIVLGDSTQPYTTDQHLEDLGVLRSLHIANVPMSSSTLSDVITAVDGNIVLFITGNKVIEYYPPCPRGYYGLHCNQLCPLSDLCPHGWYGELCDAECPGGSRTPCRQHIATDNEGNQMQLAVCDDGKLGTGECITCPPNWMVGTYNECDTCQSQWAGSNCSTQCECTHGTCGGVTGSTQCAECYPMWSGPDCEIRCWSPCHHGTSETNCHINGTGLCACATHWIGDRCEICPDGWAGENCDAECWNGACVHGNQAECDVQHSGLCECVGNWDGLDCNECKPGWAGATCEIRCAEVCHGGNTKLPCDKTSTGQCSCADNFTGEWCDRCKEGYAGSNCEIQCPNTCPGVLQCSDGIDGTGECDKCPLNTTGPNCEIGCHCSPGLGSGCRGNGTIHGDGGCAKCLSGRFGQNCEACLCQASDGIGCVGTTETAVSLYGPSAGWCTTCKQDRFGYRCELCPNCNHGWCNQTQQGNGKCVCQTGWYGERCDQCAPNAFGPMCQPCTCSPLTGEGCHGAGTSEGDGTCYQCKLNYFGKNCEKKCGCLHGACNDGVYGDGACSCDLGWTGKNCHICAVHFAGPTCQRCHCVNGQGCDGNGTTGGTGGCQMCDEGWWDPFCATPCFECGAHGQCTYGPLATGVCVCESGWTGKGCERCDAGFAGKNCERCQCVHGSGCQGEGQLVGDGSCDPDSCKSGWAGKNCDKLMGSLNIGRGPYVPALPTVTVDPDLVTYIQMAMALPFSLEAWKQTMGDYINVDGTEIRVLYDGAAQKDYQWYQVVTFDIVFTGTDISSHAAQHILMARLLSSNHNNPSLHLLHIAGFLLVGEYFDPHEVLDHVVPVDDDPATTPTRYQFDSADEPSMTTAVVFVVVIIPPIFLLLAIWLIWIYLRVRRQARRRAIMHLGGVTRVRQNPLEGDSDIDDHGLPNRLHRLGTLNYSIPSSDDELPPPVNIFTISSATSGDDPEEMTTVMSLQDEMQPAAGSLNPVDPVNATPSVDQRGNAELDSSGDCVVCLCAKANTVIFPCYHSVLCVSCSRSRLKTCPVCRTVIAGIHKIYQ